MSLAVPARKPFVLRESVRSFLIVLVAATFALPVKLFNVGEVEIPLAILIVFLGPFLALTSTRRIAHVGLLAAAFGASVVSAGLWDVFFSHVGSFRPYFSLVFFFMPYLGYFTGYVLVRSPDDLRRFVSIASLVGVISALGIAFTLLATRSPVRIEGDIQGSLLGLPLYATHGVNSLAITEFILFALIWINLFFGKRPALPLLILKFSGMLVLAALVVLSLSRGALLSMVAFILLAMTGIALRRPVLALGLVIGFAAIGAAVTVTFGDALATVWQVRIAQSSAEDNDANALTSGRLTLVNAALSDVEDNPVLGTGFSGFQRSRATLDEEDALNSSPHNQYLTMMWKPGIVAGAFLFAFLARSVGSLARIRRRQATDATTSGLWFLTLATLGVACFTWDVLLVPNIGAFSFFLFGAAASIDQGDRV